MSISTFGNGATLISRCGENASRCYNFHGNVLRRINFDQFTINIHIVGGGHIIATDSNIKAVEQISLDVSKVMQLIYTSPLTPIGLCVNHQGNIVVVCRKKPFYNALQEFSCDGKRKFREIKCDAACDYLFPSPYLVVQNSNHDYIVSNERELVTMSNEGRLLWRYSGKVG